jgi:hypothetical protein
MNLTYALTETGYQIFADGVLWIDQPFDPLKVGFQPFDSQEAAQAAAEAFIAERS